MGTKQGSPACPGGSFFNEGARCCMGMVYGQDLRNASTQPLRHVRKLFQKNSLVQMIEINRRIELAEKVKKTVG